jgi:hypothetical protein
MVLVDEVVKLLGIMTLKLLRFVMTLKQALVLLNVLTLWSWFGEDSYGIIMGNTVKFFELILVVLIEKFISE